MTQPARRPTTSTETAEIAFLGATAIPDRLPTPATPLPEIPFLHASTSPRAPPPTLVPQKQKQGSGKQRSQSGRLMRSVRAAFRSFPAIQAPSCRDMPSLHHVPGLQGAGVRSHFHGATHAKGTLYGHRRAWRVLLDIGVPTARFIQDVSAAGMVRVTLECEKQRHAVVEAGARRLLDEPVWTAEVNGESVGYVSWREATERDECVMRMLHSTSVGVSVLPAHMSHPSDGELSYMRAHFDRLVGSKDSETYYMHNPEGATGPELTIFFIRT